MATIAAVVAAGATVAAAGMSAASASGSKGGGGAPAPEQPSLHERLFNRGTADILVEERRVIEDGLAQGNMLTPEMYRILGYEPQYDEAQEQNLQALSNRADELRNAINKGEERMFSARAERQQINKTLKGKEKQKAIKALNKEIKSIKQQAPNAKRALALAEREFGAAQAVPRRIVALNRLPSVQSTNPTSSDLAAEDPTAANSLYRQAFDMENQALVRALRGEEPLDATLRTALDEKETLLRERLLRTLGIDYETSTAGAQALANFDRERAEALQQYNTALIKDYTSMTNTRAQLLTEMTSAGYSQDTTRLNNRGLILQQLLYPANQQIARAGALGAVSGARQEWLEGNRRERAQSYEQKRKAAADEASAAAAQNAALMQGIGGALSAVGQGASAFSTGTFASA